MSVYGDLGKNHDPGGSQRKPLTDNAIKEPLQNGFF
jgi:hypothetical protein